MRNHVEDEILGYLDNKQRMLKKNATKVVYKVAPVETVKSLQDTITNLYKQREVIDAALAVKIRKLNDLVVQ